MIKMIVSLLHNLFEEDEHLLALEERFKERVNIYYAEREKILVSEVHILMNDDYINTASIRTMEDKSNLFEEMIDSLRGLAKK